MPKPEAKAPVLATLAVSRLPPTWILWQVRDLFRRHGCPLVGIRLAIDREARGKGRAVVVLPSPDADKGVALNGTAVAGKALRVVRRRR